MKKIFICAPNRHKEKTRKLADKLEKVGFSVKYAAEFTKQNMETKDIFESNMKLIKNSDIFLAYFVDDGHYGIDFAVEVGQVSGMGRPVFGFADLHENKMDEFQKKLDKDVMFIYSIDTLVWDFNVLLEHLKTH
ncbi:MAG: nucleoside 2-deoxyribosyltransferase [Chlamydiales bacterium]|nr:nucleoside 2-deoxyribosyltransferase [Chlamydiales bacterium]